MKKEIDPKEEKLVKALILTFCACVSIASICFIALKAGWV